jgi:hypothetical protein
LKPNNARIKNKIIKVVQFVEPVFPLVILVMGVVTLLANVELALFIIVELYDVESMIYIT